MADAKYHNGSDWILVGAVSRTILPYNGGEEDYQAHGNSGSTETIDLADGNLHSLTLDANCTLTFTGANSGAGCSFTLVITQDATGSRTVTWPGTVLWPFGIAPTLSTAANSIDIVTFLTHNGGASWFGFAAGLDFS